MQETEPGAAPFYEPLAGAPAPLESLPEEDIAAASPPLFVKIAAGVSLLAGFAAAFTGLQTFIMAADPYHGPSIRYVLLRGPVGLVPYVFVLAGATVGILGIPLFRARAWAAIVVTLGAGLVAVAGAAWLAYSTNRGLLSLMAMGTPFVALAAAILAGLSMPACVRVTRARARLADHGMHLGI